MKQGKVRRRAKLTRDILDPLTGYQSRKTAIANSALLRAETKLIELIEQTRYKEASILFMELLKTTRFSLANTWKAGAEIFGHCAPHLLADYLKAVYVYSPMAMAPAALNTYVDQLMIDRKWAKAIDEIELVYHRSSFTQPILLRKLGVCAYRQWEESKNKLPKEYFEDGIEVEDNRLVTLYHRHTEEVKKYLPATCREFIRDPEILEMYCNFLTFAQDEKTKKKYIRLALEEVKKEPDYHLLFFLLKVNGDDLYFESKKYTKKMNKLYSTT